MIEMRHSLKPLAVILCSFLAFSSMLVSGEESEDAKDIDDKIHDLGSNNHIIKKNLELTGITEDSITAVIDKYPGQSNESAPPTPGVGANKMLDKEPSLPEFIEEPEDQYIVKAKPVQLSCAVLSSTKTHFKCNGRLLGEDVTTTTQEENEESGTQYTRISIEISRLDFDAFFAPYTYWCQCIAFSGAGQTKSRKASVKLAYLRRNFEYEPVGGRVAVGNEFKLSCTPPKGLPEPTVEWMKNDELLTPSESSNYLITQDGDLIIQTRSIEDSGNYTCIAKNIVTQRRRTASIRVGVNGGWSSWSAWSGCEAKCGIGEKRRLRTCTQPAPVNGGVPCLGDSIQTRVCTNLCPVNGSWTDWSNWSTCSPECQYRRRRTCTRPKPHNGGQGCLGADMETENCTNGLCVGTARSNASESVEEGNLLIYGGVCAALGLLVVLAIVALIAYKCRGKVFRSRRYSSRRSVRSYSSAPHSGGMVQSRDFCIIPTKPPPLSDNSAYPHSPRYACDGSFPQYGHASETQMHPSNQYNFTNRNSTNMINARSSTLLNEKYLIVNGGQSRIPKKKCTAQQVQDSFVPETHILSENDYCALNRNEDFKENFSHHYPTQIRASKLIESSNTNEAKVNAKLKPHPEYDSGFEDSKLNSQEQIQNSILISKTSPLNGNVLISEQYETT